MTVSFFLSVGKQVKEHGPGTSSFASFPCLASALRPKAMLTENTQEIARLYRDLKELLEGNETERSPEEAARIPR
ncbi:hypothetical protein KSF_087870 [Reticulibacter mediterranei]|uniref:Uncharacterized protein n=1 Tax=Reticulibacter mediterranei TaxID=2778369 RepID=A0A8J3N557_9CHLR|nr:hypothetical protein KSF_087870 [Reticulibacter mediterranei]